MKKLLICIAVLSMMTIAHAQDKLTPGPGEVEITYLKKGTQLGVWNPQTRVYTQTSVYADGPLAGQHHQMTFNENGEVINREELLLGFKQEDGSWKAGKIENVLNSSYMVLWNMEVIGNIIDNIVTIHGVPMVSTSAPMDTDVLTFIVFCNHWGPTQINHIKETVEKEKAKQIAEAQAREAKQPQQNFDGTILDKDNFRVSKISSDGYFYDKKGYSLGKLDLAGNKEDYYVYDKKGYSLGKLDLAGNKEDYYVYDKNGYSLGRLTLAGNKEDYYVYDKKENSIGRLTLTGDKEGYYVYDKKENSIGRFDAPAVWIGALFFFVFE